MIQRYHAYGTYAGDDGPFVDYNDHLAALAAKDAEIASLERECAVRNERELGYLSRAQNAEAEAAGLRADAERYRELRRLATAWPQTVLVVNINIGHDWRTADAPEEIDSVVDAAIDAARGGDK